MTGLTIEATLELWASSLRDVKARIGPLFNQVRVARSAGQFLDGLLGDERRKTGWMRAEAAGDPGASRPFLAAATGMLMGYATSCVIMHLRHWPTMMRFWSLMKPASSNRARRHVGLLASIRDQQARSPTARLVFSLPMSRAMAIASSTGRFICQRPGPRHPHAWQRPMFRKEPVLRPSLPLPLA